MSDYVRLRVQAEASEYSTYAQASTHPAEVELTPDEWMVGQTVDAEIGGMTIDTSWLTTVTGFIVSEVGGTNAVNVHWHSGVTANTVTLQAGGILILTDATIDPAEGIVLTGQVGTARCKVSVFGT